MKKMTLSMIVLITAFSLTACGKSTTPTNATTTTATATAAATSKPSEATAGSDELAKIKKAGVINVGIEGAYPPFNSYDNDKQLVGFDVDLTNEFAKRLGVKVNFVVTPWDSIIAGLLAKKFDILLSSMGITEERKQKVDFSNPYYTTYSALFVPTNSAITDPKQMTGKKIGALLGSKFADDAKELGGIVSTYKNDTLAHQDMSLGRLDGVITDKIVGAVTAKANNYPEKRIDKPLTTYKIGIAVNKGEPALLNEINTVLKSIMDDGTYTKISTKWFNEDIR
jgi:ABC-type amino acid transport substrate-binding protein